MSRGRILRVALAGVLVIGMSGPIPARSASLSLGSVRGVRAADLSLDGGDSWVALASRALPVLDGTQLRTSNGAAAVDLSDGSRLDVMPFSLLHFREASGGTLVSLRHGRMGFRLPRDTRAAIGGPTARLEPVRAAVMQGEFLVTRDGTMGLRMSAGNLEVHELAGSRAVQLASIEPVFLPRRPPMAESLFTHSVATAPPPGSRAVFDPRGESLGYLRPDAQLVVQPGFTADLTRPFPAKLVQLAMARIDEKNRADAVPVFDVNGGYVGYLAGPAFHPEPSAAPTQLAQAQITPAFGVGAGGGGAGAILGMSTTTFLVASGSVLAVAGVSAAAASGAFSPATPTAPSR